MMKGLYGLIERLNLQPLLGCFPVGACAIGASASGVGSDSSPLSLPRYSHYINGSQWEADETSPDVAVLC